MTLLRSILVCKIDREFSESYVSSFSLSNDIIRLIIRGYIFRYRIRNSGHLQWNIPFPLKVYTNLIPRKLPHWQDLVDLPGLYYCYQEYFSSVLLSLGFLTHYTNVFVYNLVTCTSASFPSVWLLMSVGDLRLYPFFCLRGEGMELGSRKPLWSGPLCGTEITLL